MDDKALISNLLMQGSDRVQLVVFKEARAEIWQIFRLVYLDNKPMPYAVCIKCLKPVAYCKKTTGSLHKHPCANSVTKFWSKSLKRKRKNEEDPEKKSIEIFQNQNIYETTATFTTNDRNGQTDFNRLTSTNLLENVSLSNIQQAALYGANNLSFLQNLNKSQQNLDALTGNINQNVSGNILVRFAGDLGSTNGTGNCQSIFKDKTDQIVKLTELVCQNLIDLDDQTFELLNNQFFLKQNGSTIFPKLEFDEVKSYLKRQFNKSKQEIRKKVLTMNSLNLIVDFWTNPVFKSQFITVWAYINNDIQILSTKNISYIEDYNELIRILDEIRCDFIQPNKPYFYLFDNEIPDYCSNVNELFNKDKVSTCLKHQLYSIVKRLYNENCPIIILIKNVFKLTTDVLEKYQHYMNSFNLIEILKKIFDEYDDFEAQLLKKGFLIRDTLTKLDLESILQVLMPLLYTFQAIGKNVDDLFLYFNLFKTRLEINENQDTNLIKNLKRKLKEGIEDFHFNEHLFVTRLYLEPKIKNSKDVRSINYDNAKISLKNMIEIRKNLNKNNSVSPSTLSLTFPAKSSEEELVSQIKDEDELNVYDLMESNQMFNEFWENNKTILPNLKQIAFSLDNLHQNHKCCTLNDYGKNLAFKRLKLSKNENFNEILFLNSHLNFSTKQE